MFGLFLIRDWHNRIHIMSSNQLRDRVMADSMKSNYNWIAPVYELLSICNKKDFDKNCAIDIKMAILNCYTNLLSQGVDVSKNIDYVYKTYNQLFGEERAVKVRENFLRVYIREITRYSVMWPRHWGDVFDNFYLEWESRVINDLSNKKNINFYKLKIALKEEYDNLVKVEEDKGTFEESDKKYWDEFHKNMKKFRKEVGKSIVEAGSLLLEEEGRHCLKSDDNVYSGEDDEQIELDGEVKTIKPKNK